MEYVFAFNPFLYTLTFGEFVCQHYNELPSIIEAWESKYESGSNEITRLLYDAIVAHEGAFPEQAWQEFARELHKA